MERDTIDNISIINSTECKQEDGSPDGKKLLLPNRDGNSGHPLIVTILMTHISFLTYFSRF